MTSIVELFPKSRKLAYDARQQLAQVRNGVRDAMELRMTLEELSKQLDAMEQLVLRETPQQRAVWKRKIQELRNDAASVDQQAEQHQQYVARNRHQSEREELLTRRRQRKQASSQQEADMRNLAEEGQSWQQSQFMVNDLISSGEASLNNLVEQRSKLRGVSRFLGQIDDSLGISSTTMRIIERRDETDKYFVLAGMVVTCINFYIFWFWL